MYNRYLMLLVQTKIYTQYQMVILECDKNDELIIEEPEDEIEDEIEDESEDELEEEI